MTLRIRLILLLLLATLPLIGVEIYSEIGIRAERQQEVSETATRLLDVVDAEQDRIDEGAHQLLVAFSQNPAIRNGDWAECNRAVGQIISSVTGYINLGVADLDGNTLCAHLATSSTRFGQTRAQYAAVDQHKDFAVGTYIVGNVSHLRGLPLSIPWRDQAGNLRGTIWATLDLHWLAEHFAERFYSADMTLLMTDRNGTIILRQPDNDAWVGKSIGDPRNAPPIAAPS